jgi:hypothetical protein
VCSADNNGYGDVLLGTTSVGPWLTDLGCSSTAWVVAGGVNYSDVGYYAGSTYGSDDVFLCPAGITVPSTLRDCGGRVENMFVISTGMPFCSDAVGRPNSGWELIIDTCGGNGGGGCHGTCASQ